jgi:hypothetical protein
VEVRVIAGNAANNALAGSALSEIIFARKCSDTAIGRGANDLLCGGNGNDKLTGGVGADHFGEAQAPTQRPTSTLIRRQQGRHFLKRRRTRRQPRRAGTLLAALALLSSRSLFTRVRRREILGSPFTGSCIEPVCCLPDILSRASCTEPSSTTCTGVE